MIHEYWKQHQAHLLPYMAHSQSLSQEISTLDPTVVQQAITQCLQHQSKPLNEYIPASYRPLQPDSEQAQLEYQQAIQEGTHLITEGKVAAFTVAGGQGTRLGYNGPKGTLPVSPIKQKSLFQLFAEQIYAWNQQARQPIAWYIMCSPLNIDATQEFFEHHQYFGLNAQDVSFFTQGMLPAFNSEGKLLLKDPDHLALSPNGHGGSFKALIDAQAITDMQQRGVEYISYFQVDNPLVHIFDPLFIGLHHQTHSEMSSRCLIKSNALEKLGNFVLIDQQLHIIEYSDLPDEKAKQTQADGRLYYRAGSPAIHMIRRDFIEKFADQSLQLPYHKAVKKVPYLNAQGHIESPEEPNAIKAETFVFDALPLAHHPLILEAERSEQFSPVKNKTGIDSLEQSQQDQNSRAQRWLRSLGYDVPHECSIEISPRVFPNQNALSKAKLPIFKVGQSYYIDETYL